MHREFVANLKSEILFVWRYETDFTRHFCGIDGQKLVEVFFSHKQMMACFQNETTGIGVNKVFDIEKYFEWHDAPKQLSVGISDYEIIEHMQKFWNSYTASDSLYYFDDLEKRALGYIMRQARGQANPAIVSSLIQSFIKDRLYSNA